LVKDGLECLIVGVAEKLVDLFFDYIIFSTRRVEKIH
jgi:hypothetical protein